MDKKARREITSDGDHFAGREEYTPEMPYGSAEEIVIKRTEILGRVRPDTSASVNMVVVAFALAAESLDQHGRDGEPTPVDIEFSYRDRTFRASIDGLETK